MKLSKFLQINKNLVENGKLFPFKIYRKLEDESFTTLVERSVAVKEEIANIALVEDFLYVKKEEIDLYKKYLESLAGTYLSDSKIEVVKKITLLNEITSMTISNLFDSKLTTKNVKNVSLVVSYVVDLASSSEDAIFHMIKDLSVDYDVYKHCVDVAYYAIGFGIYLKLTQKEVSILGKAAILHNIGIREIDPAIINRAGKLSDLELKEVRQHPRIGLKLLKQTGITDKTLLTIVEQHHEKCDGSGYPNRLLGHEIHYLTKILTICDIFAAITTKKEYRDRDNTFHALGIMLREMWHELNPEYLKEFVKFMSAENSSFAPSQAKKV